MFYTTLGHDLREIYPTPDWYRFYFLDEIPSNLRGAKYVCEIELDSNSQIISDFSGRKVNKCFIHRPMKVADFIRIHNLAFSVLAADGLALRFIRNQTQAHCLTAVKNNGLALRFANHRTEEICWEAVRQNGLALRFVRDQTEAQCITGVKQNPYALLLVKDKTLNVCRLTSV